MSALHPSHAAPKCLDCKHLIERGGTPKCGHPSAPVNLVTGAVDLPASTMRTVLHKVILDRLAITASCGPEGRFFEAKPAEEKAPEPCPECHGSGRVRIPFSSQFAPCALCSA